MSIEQHDWCIDYCIGSAFKILINATMALGESIEIIPNFFRLTNVHNTGAAWSIFEGKMIFFYLITIVFLIAMVYFYRTSEDADTFTKLGMILMMAGAVGNFIDTSGITVCS